MSFDQNSNLPVVNLHKKTTQVNVGMIASVLIFFVICAATYMWFSRHQAETVNAMHEKQTSESAH